MAIAIEVMVLLALVLANGFFAAAEIAIITARRGRLEQEIQAGNRRAKIAEELARNPTRFLSTVQVGITFVGTLAAVFGGARLVDSVAEALACVPVEMVVRHREAIAMVFMVLVLSFLSLMIGELVPKRVALANAERLALAVSVPMLWVYRLGRPVVAVISGITDTILRLLGQGAREAAPLSIEDIEHLIRAGTREGILQPAEQLVASKALRFGDRTVKDIMRPRIEIDALDVDTPTDEVIGAVAMSGFSRVPVHEGDMDHILGFVYTKDLLRQQHLGWPINLRKMLRPALLVPATLHLDRLLELFRRRHTHMAIVLDEFGGTDGLVTLDDVLQELIGEMHDENWHDRQQDIVQRGDGSWLIDGTVNLAEVLGRIGYPELRSRAPRGITTVAGLVLHVAGKIPAIGQKLTWRTLEIEVVDLDGQRIDRVSIKPGGKAST